MTCGNGAGSRAYRYAPGAIRRVSDLSASKILFPSEIWRIGIEFSTFFDALRNLKRTFMSAIRQHLDGGRET
jgi:hypothetical protein